MYRVALMANAMKHLLCALHVEVRTLAIYAKYVALPTISMSQMAAKTRAAAIGLMEKNKTSIFKDR